MIPGMRKGNLQRIIVILFIGYMIFQFSGSFSLLNIPFLVKIGDKEHINNLFIYSFVIYNLFLYRKLIFLNKLKCEISKWLDDLQYYVYIGIFYVSVIYSNINKFSLNEKIKIYLLLFIGLILGIIIFICFYENFSRENENKQLFPTRINDMEYFKNLISTIKNETIMIEGEWGQGKTFFVDVFLEKNKKKYIGIKIKASLFKNKEEVRKFIFQEFETLLNIYNIKGNNLIKILNKIEFNKINYLGKLFQENMLLEEDKERIRKMFSMIKDKEIVLILDDIERIPKISQRKEIISLLSEFEEYVELKKIVLVNSNELKIESKYLDKYVNIKFQISNLVFEEILQKIIPEVYWNSYRKFLGNLYKTLDGNRRIQSEENEIYNEVKKIESLLLIPRILKQINLEFYKYGLDKLCKEERYKDEVIEAFIICHILKTYYPKFFMHLREDDDLDLIVWRLKNLNVNEENTIILRIFDILMTENVVKKQYFQKFVNCIEIIPEGEKLKRESIKIFELYKKIDNWNKYIVDLKAKLLFDIKIVYLAKSQKTLEKEKLEEFYENYKNVLWSLYKSKKLNLVDIVEVLLSKYIYQFKAIDFPLKEIEISEDMIDNYNLKQSFFNLDKSLLNNYEDLLLLFFEIESPVSMYHNINSKKFNTIKTILKLEENCSIDEIVSVLDCARNKYKIDKNEKKYVSLIENLKFLSKLYDKYEGYEKYGLKKVHEDIYSKDYTYEELKKNETELKEKIGIYKFKYLEKLKKVSL